MLCEVSVATKPANLTRDVINLEANEDVRKLCALSVNQQAVV